MDDRLLSIYLNDHLAGAMLGRALAQRCLSRNRATSLGEFLEGLAAEGCEMPLGQGIAGRIAAQRQPLVVPNLQTENDITPALSRRGIRSLGLMGDLNGDEDS